MKARTNRILGTLVCAILVATSYGQSEKSLDYTAIPDYPESYTAGTVAARLLDGLGFRYYWATDSLRNEDLAFRPSEAARTSGETLDHILDLTEVIRNTALKKVHSGLDKEGMSFAEKRARTIENIRMSADIFREASGSEMAEYEIVFQGEGDQTRSYPLWNLINGPIADAIWHVGQVVTFRRSSGNPFNSKVSVFNGRLRE